MKQPVLLGIYLLFGVIVGSGLTVAKAQQAGAPAPQAQGGGASGMQCPTPQPCKIVIISVDEEQTLLGQNMIFEMAEWAMRPLGPTIQAWRRKIESSPAGAPAKK